MKMTAVGVRANHHRPSLEAGLSTCLACGAEIESALSRLGSLRCHDCRDTTARLDPLRLHTSHGRLHLRAFRLARRARTSAP